MYTVNLPIKKPIEADQLEALRKSIFQYLRDDFLNDLKNDIYHVNELAAMSLNQDLFCVHIKPLKEFLLKNNYNDWVHEDDKNIYEIIRDCIFLIQYKLRHILGESKVKMSYNPLLSAKKKQFSSSALVSKLYDEEDTCSHWTIEFDNMALKKLQEFWGYSYAGAIKKISESPHTFFSVSKAKIKYSHIPPKGNLFALSTVPISTFCKIRENISGRKFNYIDFHSLSANSELEQDFVSQNLAYGNFREDLVICYINAAVGFGVFAAVDIEQGENMGIYAGIVCHQSCYSESFYYSFKNPNDNCSVIEAERAGNILSLVNHAPTKRSSTMEGKYLTANLMVEEKATGILGNKCIYYIASQPIKAGSQLLVDYGGMYWSGRECAYFDQNHNVYNMAKPQLRV